MKKEKETPSGPLYLILDMRALILASAVNSHELDDIDENWERFILFATHDSQEACDEVNEKTYGESCSVGIIDKHITRILIEWKVNGIWAPRMQKEYIPKYVILDSVAGMKAYPQMIENVEDLDPDWKRFALVYDKNPEKLCRMINSGSYGKSCVIADIVTKKIIWDFLNKETGIWKSNI